MSSDRPASIDIAASQPPDLAKEVYDALEQKADMPFTTMMALGILAGSYIAFGGLFALVALAGASELPYGMGQVTAGLVFSVGLALVIVAGAELFTGNTLMAGPTIIGRLPAGKLFRTWSVVYVANLFGSLVIVTLALAAGAHLAGDGAVGRAALELAANKTSMSFGAAFASGVLANMLVCLAVWLGYSAKSVSDKFFAVLLPIAAFVAAGFEHSVANMFLIPFGLGVEFLSQPAVMNDAAIEITARNELSFYGFLSNLTAATLGNIVGGATIALAYFLSYLRD